jgi:hypothetical protein
MKLTTLALLLLLAGLSGFAYRAPAWAGSCSHCVFDDDPPLPPPPKRGSLG